MNKNQSFITRLGYAISGLRQVYSHERSFRTQVLCALAVLVALLVLQPAAIWWGLILTLVGLILFAEMVNTAMENLCDWIQPEYHEKVKEIKDIMAGAVLLLSITAVIIAAIMLVAELAN